MLLAINNLAKNFGTEDVFSDINLRVDKIDHIGLIGINGSGKSTLLKIITGEVTPDGGNVSFASGAQLGYLKQDLGLEPENTVYDEALRAFDKVIALEAELERRRLEIERTKDEALLEKMSAAYLSLTEKFEAMRGYYYKSLASAALKGLGFSQEYFSRPISELSGGQKMRVALAKLLVSEPDILLLDEPTNYLDISSVMWLENYLSSYPKAYIVVSHDRYFLDKTVSTVWELDGTVKTYRGNYTQYLKIREDEILAQQKAYKVQSEYIKRQREIIRKLKSFNREKSVKRAESREKLLDKIEVLEKPKFKASSDIRFETKSVISRNALFLRDLAVGYDGRAVVNGINAEIKQGTKVGICGDNAAGKSTLLKTVAGQIAPVDGEIVEGAGVIISYFRQHHDDLNPDNTILDELVAYSGADTQRVRDVLGSMLFSAEDVYKNIGVLSGGEQSRVEVAKLMLTPCNVLLLDEPTNHLDIASKEVFEEAIRDFPGTVLLVSHDRYLLSSTCDKILHIHDNLCDFYNAGYEKASEMFSRGEKPPLKEDTDNEEAIREEEKPQPKKSLSKNEYRRALERIPTIEKELENIERRRAELEAEINGEGFYKNSLSASEKLEEYDRLADEHKALEEEWLELSYLTEEK